MRLHHRRSQPSAAREPGSAPILMAGSASIAKFHHCASATAANGDRYNYVLPCGRRAPESRLLSRPARTRSAMYLSTPVQSALARAEDATLLVDEAGTILFANAVASHLLKYAVGELRGQKLELLIPDRYRVAHIGHRLSFMDDRRTRPMGAGKELFALRKDGSELRVAVGLTPLQDGLKTLMIATIQVLETGAATPERLP